MLIVILEIHSGSSQFLPALNKRRQKTILHIWPGVKPKTSNYPRTRNSHWNWRSLCG